MRETVPPSEFDAFDVCFMPTTPILSNHIAESIKNQGYTYREAAEKIGSSRQALDLYIHGELQPTVEIALKLSHLLDIPVEDLFQLEEGAWYTSAKDENGHTIFYDHWKEQLLSGTAMKGKRKTERYNKETGESISPSGFKQVVKQAETEAVEAVLERDGRDAHTRDTLARIKENVRDDYERHFPIRYEPLYRRIQRLDERR